MRQNDFFSIGVIKMVDSVSALLVIYGLVPLLKYKVADYYLENISNGELSAVPYQNHSFILFCIGTLFFKLFPILIRKARDVEKDQTLTI